MLAEIAHHVERFGPGNEGLILHLPDGLLMRRDRFVKVWRATADAADLPAVRFHDLRHHFELSRLINAGCSVKAVQTVVGHERASTTLDTYGHLWPGDEDRCGVRWPVCSLLCHPCVTSLGAAEHHRR